MDHLKQALASLQRPKPQRVIYYLKALRDEKLGKHRQFLATQDATEGMSQEFGSDFLTEVQLLEAAIDAVQADTDLQESFANPPDVVIKYDPKPEHSGSAYSDCPACQEDRRQGPAKGWDHRADLTKSESKEELARLLEKSKKHPDYDPRGTFSQPVPPSIWVNGSDKEKK